jgi:hypothetical protein
MQQKYDDLDMYEYRLRCVERKYQAYVMKAAWSDEDCYRVDQLNADMENFIRQIQSIRDFIESARD